MATVLFSRITYTGYPYLFTLINICLVYFIMCRDQSMQLCLFHAAKIDKHVTTNKLFEFLFALTENILTYIKTPLLTHIFS